jgi:hypothetical protein
MGELPPRLNWARTIAVARTGQAVDRLSALLHRPRVEDAIVIASSPRAGSTLLMDILATLDGYRTVFEPLHPHWYAGVRQLGLGPRPCLVDGAAPEGTEAYLREVLTGREAGAYRLTRFAATLPGRLLEGDLVVKCVRLNRLLPWFESTFDTRGTVLLLRHPCATVESQLRSNVHGYPDHRAGFPPAEQVQDHALRALDPGAPEDLRERIRSVDTPAGLMALSWAVDTLIALSHPGPERTTVFYEDLVTDGPAQLDRLFGALDTARPARALDVLGAPSLTVDEDADGQDYLERWTEGLDDEQTDRILEIAAWFGLEDLYDEAPTPRVDRAGDVQLPAWVDRPAQPQR